MLVLHWVPSVKCKSTFMQRLFIVEVGGRIKILLCKKEFMSESSKSLFLYILWIKCFWNIDFYLR